jgi:hypothetical protein
MSSSASSPGRFTELVVPSSIGTGPRQQANILTRVQVELDLRKSNGCGRAAARWNCLR